MESHHRLKPGSFKTLTYLSLFGLAITVPLLLLVGALLFQSASAQRTQLEARVSQVLRALVNSLDRDVDRNITILHTLATSQVLASADWATFYNQAKAGLQGRAYLVLTDRDGRQLVNTYVPYGQQPAMTGDPETVRRMLQTKAPVVSNLFVSLVVKKPVFNVSIPILQDGEVRYVMSLGLLPDDLVTLLKAQNLGPEWVTNVWDAHGNILARSQDSQRYIGTLLPQNMRERTNQPTVVRTNNLDGLDVLHATVRSQVSGWGVGVNVSYSLITEQMRNSLFLWIATGLIAITIAILSGAFFARQITSSLSAAATAATAFGRGERFPLAGSRLKEADAFLAALEAARQSQEQLTREVKQNRDWLHTTLASIADAVIATDQAGRITFLNDVAARLTGWPQEDAIGRPLEDIFVIRNEETGEPTENPVAKALREERAVGLSKHTELIRKTGEHIPIDDSSAPIRDEAGQVVGGVLVFRDISGRRRAEKELAASEHRSRTILESISDGFFLLDQEWRYSLINQTAERIMRKPVAELVGRSHWEVHPETVGTQVEVLYKKAVAERIPIRFENYYEPWDCWFDIAAYPSSEGLSVYFRDITERKRTEAALLRLNEDLKQFTYAATHDLREPLRMIIIYAQMLERKLETDGDENHENLKGYLSHIVSGAKRLGRLIDGLLEFSRVGEVESTPLVPVNAQTALQEALDDLQIAISESRAEISSAPLPRVLATHVHVRQLLQNLIGNALKYRQRDVTPTISISVKGDGGSWIFAVKDDGIGIDPAHHGKIFVPFKRLHSSEVAGAGIGLATCKRIVERYDGRIWVESQLGNGATFYFSLPAAEEAAHVD